METVKLGFHLVIRYFAGILVSFVIFLSVMAVFTLPLTEAIGYDAYIADEAAGHSRKVYTHYYADGQDTKKAEYEAQGLTVYTAELRSELTGAGAAAVFTAAQLMSLVLFLSLVPNRLYRLGAEDAQSHRGHSLSRWFVPTLFPAAISFTGYILLVLNKLQWIGNRGLSLYRYANYHLYGFQRMITGTGNDGSQLGWTAVVLAILPTVLTVLLCGILYEFGYRNMHPLISLKNRIKYRSDP